jgi:hypothetical protein
MGKTFLKTAAAAALTMAGAAFGQQAATGPRTFTFDGDAVGAAPAGFEFARTGGGAEGRWVVEADKEKPANHVLTQSSADPTDNRFPLAIVKDGTYKDVTLSVRARPISGKVDQGFGLVWRYRDASNYYVTRCNADEDNCTIYHVVRGSRRAFQNKIGQGRDEHVAHAEGRGRRQPFRRDLRRAEGARRHRRHVQG